MPIITLYGTKGGSCRTTGTTIMALGLALAGKSVTLVSTDGDMDVFDDWVRTALEHGDPDWDLQTFSLLGPGDGDRLKRHLDADPDHFAIIDTARFVSPARSYALACADLVVMPFLGFLEARSGVESAAAQIPQGQQLVAVSGSGDEQTIREVARWMPLMQAPYPLDERLIPYSIDMPEFLATLTGAPNLPVDTYRLRLAVEEFAQEAAGVALAKSENPQESYFVPALRTSGVEFKRNGFGT